MKNKENVGNLDRIIRVYAGVFLIVSFIVGFLPSIGFVPFITGLFLVITAIIGVCPFYKLIGIHTTRRHYHAR